jgi:hypothetical protein
MQHFAKMHLPFGLLSRVRNLKILNGDSSSFSLKDECPQINEWASIATLFNYITPVHKDKYTFLSCLTVSYMKKGTKEIEKKLDYDMPIAVYFCFPEIDTAVALYPGEA